MKISRTLVDRLRGIYRIPILDGLGAVEGSEEPDNDREYVRTYSSTPIMHEAADVIEYLLTSCHDIELFYE